jgi:hypothetical protein
MSGSLQAPSNLPPGKEHWCLWNRRLGGPQSRPVIFERGTVLSVAGFESRTIQPVAWSLPITICRLLLKITYIPKLTNCVKLVVPGLVSSFIFSKSPIQICLLTRALTLFFWVPPYIFFSQIYKVPETCFFGGEGGGDPRRFGHWQMTHNSSFFWPDTI